MPLTIPDLIDNSSSERNLSKILNELLNENVITRIATGFFNLGGYTLVRDKLNQSERVSLLLGTEPSGIQSPDTGGYTQNIRDDIENDLFQAMGSGTRLEHNRVRDFLAFLQKNTVQVRLYTRHFFHAKAYILDRVPPFGTIAIVGSSNFTTAGLTANTELNMAQKQAAVAREFVEWFDRFWNESEEYKNALIELYTRAVALHTPYLVYIKTLYETFQDRIGADLAPSDDRPSPILLADFQHDGYLAAKDILEMYGGVIIADPVGLGKTFLGLRLLDDYAYQLRQKTLIVCPAQLRDTIWDPRLRDYVIRADIVSQEKVSQEDFMETAPDDYELVVIDESHNFRNPNAQRYDNLAQLLKKGKRKKLILLTATPVNTSVFDLLQQVKLITGDRDDYFAGIGINSLRGYFVQADQDRETLHDLLETIAVRRSRQFIRANYPTARIDGNIVTFPERELHTVDYNLEETYEGLYEQVAETIDRLILAPYMLDFYRLDIPRQLRLAFYEGEKTDLSPDTAMLLGRQIALVGIMRHLYLKRLESSVHALKISIERQMRFQQRFLEQLQQGRLLRAKAFHRVEAFLRQFEEDDSLSEEQRAKEEIKLQQDIDEILAQLEPVEENLYDIDDIQDAIQKDIAALTAIHTKLANIGAAQDDKFLTLKHLLVSELKNKKVVVFSYFKDTARYVFRELQRDTELLVNSGHKQISIADSGVGTDERKERIRRFAPKAQRANHTQGTEREIQLLISTDVLSEGQNLQDSDTVVNYDLHWNPVRMVQRAGRVDRLGSEFSIVHTYNFIPEDALETLIGLMQKLRARLDKINRAGLLDASVLGEIPTPQDFGALRRIAEEDESVWDELEAISELDIGEFLKQELLDYLKRVGEEKLKSLPPGIGTGKRALNGRRGLFVHLKGGSQHWWLFYDVATKRFLERKLEVIKLVRCDENEKAVEPDFDIYPLIEQAKRHVASRLRQARIKIPMLKPPQNHIYNFLKTQRQDDNVTTMLGYFAIPLGDRELRQLRKIWNAHKNSSVALVQELIKFTSENPSNPTARPEIPELREEDLTLVTWMALI